jgi:alcohol dehydrogenase (cytochrome c)
MAVVGGGGGGAGALVAGDLDPRDTTAATGFANVLPDLKQRTTKGGTLHVFALP